MNPTSVAPTPAAVDEARNLLAGALDAELALEPLLSVGEAYNHLEDTHTGLWAPPSAAEVADPVAALGRVHSLLTHALDARTHGLDPIQLALAIRATATALALLRPGGDAA